VPGGERRHLPHRPTELPRHLRRPLGLPDPHRPGAKPPSPIDADAGPRSRLDDRIENALLALDADDPESALVILAPVLETDPLHSDAHFVRGVAQLGAGDAEGAVVSFRRAIYIDPAFSLALFELARAHEALGDLHGARQAYEDALRTFEAPRDRHEMVLDYVDLSEVQTACAERLRALGTSS
jgi:chemotaxis protein methyltransferase WspC